MKSLRIKLFEVLLQSFIKVDLAAVQNYILQVWDDPRSGEAKRDYVINKLQFIGSTAARFFLKVAIEYVYGKVQQGLLEKAK